MEHDDDTPPPRILDLVRKLMALRDDPAAAQGEKTAAQSEATRYNLDEIRERLPMLTVCEREGIEFRREGSNWKGPCIKCSSTRGFSVHGNRPNHAHCYACGWDGDIFQFWGEKRGVGFSDAVAALAGLCNVGPLPKGIAFERKPVIHRPKSLAESGKPDMPQMWRLKPEDKQSLAELRGISIAGIDAADSFHRVGFAYWPLDKETGREYSQTKASWVITDPERWVAQFRPFKGRYYRDDEEGVKSLSTRNTNWVIGAAQLEGFQSVILTEGGADMLAAYHFLAGLDLVQKVAVTCIFGTGNNICPEARPYFAGKTVRIFADNDRPKKKETKTGSYETRAGRDAAARWQHQLEEFARDVGVVDFSELFSPDEVGDLNDLAKVDTSEIDLESLFNF